MMDFRPMVHSCVGKMSPDGFSVGPLLSCLISCVALVLIYNTSHDGEKMITPSTEASVG